MGFRLAPREVAPLPPQPVGPPFSSILGPVLPLWATPTRDEDRRVGSRNLNSPFPHAPEMESLNC